MAIRIQLKQVLELVPVGRQHRRLALICFYFWHASFSHPFSDRNRTRGETLKILEKQRKKNNISKTFIHLKKKHFDQF